MPGLDIDSVEIDKWNGLNEHCVHFQISDFAICSPRMKATQSSVTMAGWSGSGWGWVQAGLPALDWSVRSYVDRWKDAVGRSSLWKRVYVYKWYKVQPYQQHCVVKVKDWLRRIWATNPCSVLFTRGVQLNNLDAFLRLLSCGISWLLTKRW